MNTAPRIGARDRADAAGERCPADDRGGDDVELLVDPEVLRRTVEPADAMAPANEQRTPMMMNVFMMSSGC